MPVSRKLIVTVAVLAVLAAAGGAWWHFNGKSAPVESAQAATGTTTGTTAGPGYFITPRDRTLGNPKAKVVLIEYAAPVCPHCAHFNEEVVPQLTREYVDTGKVLYVFRVFPLHPEDGAVEKLARCLPKEKYFPFIDQIFKNQSKWSSGYGVTDVRGALVQQAAVQGMSEQQFDACLADTKEDAEINKVAQDGQDRYRISGTPTVIINGQPQPGVSHWDEIKPLIEAALAR